MDSPMETRVAELEAMVLQLQTRVEAEDTRRRRAGRVRIGALLLLATAYVVMFQQATSLLG